MAGEAEIWIIHRERKVLVQTPPMGPPMSVCSIDEKSAKSRGYVAVGDIHIAKDSIGGVHPLPDFGWGKAGEIAQAKAKELGYEVEFNDYFAPRYADDW